MEICCSAGALCVVLALNLFVEFSSMSSLVVNVEIENLASVCVLAFPSFLPSLKTSFNPLKESFPFFL